MSQPEIREGLTFDDVLLVPNASEVLPHEVDLRTRLTNDIELMTPLVSAAMDTVTEHETAICMARNGGIGIVHKNLSGSDQAAGRLRAFVARQHSDGPVGIIVTPW